MERSDDHFDRAKFDAVWRRVIQASGEKSPAQKQTDQYADLGGADTLRRFMDDESCDAQFYSTLACKCSGMTRQTLQRIASDEKCHLKRLRARYFILTGGTYTPPDTCPLITATADALRLKYAGEKEGAAAYREAAEQTSDQELKYTYLDLSQDEARHARTIGCLIERMF
jgi:rubrerythrin